jgi:hypothetical protein
LLAGKSRIIGELGERRRISEIWLVFPHRRICPSQTGIGIAAGQQNHRQRASWSPPEPAIAVPRWLRPAPNFTSINPAKSTS